MWKFVGAVILLLGLIGPAYACRAPTIPFDPTQQRSDTIIEGRVVEVRTNEVIVGKFFTVLVSDVVQGKYRELTYRTGWAEGVGACGPKGPDVNEGDRVRVYFQGRGKKRRELGWAKHP